MAAHLEIECAVGDAIQIGECVTIRLMECPGRAVRVGIAAPRSVQVVRGELLDEKKSPRERGLG